MSDLVAAYLEDGEWVWDSRAGKTALDDIIDGIWYGERERGEEDRWAVGTVDENDEFHPLAEATYITGGEQDCMEFAKALVAKAGV